ncbi:MAG: rod shape-determining protein MreC [Bacteroidota bacterium]
MVRLLQLLYRYREFIVFILLELTSAILSFNRERYQAVTSAVVGNILNFINDVKNHPLLKAENEKLLQDNAALRKQLLQREGPKDRLYTPVKCDFIPARVINNSIVGSKNYLTLNKGAMDGIAPGMGVMSDKGIVGRVKAVSKHFSTVISLLHTSMQVSAKLSNAAVLGTVQWPGRDPFQAQLLYVPRHVQVEPGDTVVTSGYNATFLEGAVIGHVKQVRLRKEAHFYDIELTLSTDFGTLQHVYVVNNTLKQEKDALEQHTRAFYE